MRLQASAPPKKPRKSALSLTSLKGVGPKRAKLLARKGLQTILDLLFFVPIRYEDRSQITPIDHAEEDRSVLVKGRVLYGREELFYPSRKRLYKILIKDRSGSLELIWFRYRKPHLYRFAAPGVELLAFGRIKKNRGIRQMAHPDITLTDKNTEPGLGFLPVYSEIQGIASKVLRSIIGMAMEAYLTDLVDPVPGHVTRDLGLPNIEETLRSVHFPPKDSSIDILNQFNTPFHKRLIFDRFFLVMLAMVFRKKFRENKEGPVFSAPLNLKERIDAFFPFHLTSDQARVIEEIAGDFKTKKTMNRLLMGDVGCGKTLVAIIAAYLAIRNGRQAAIMVPTQVLAEQHMTTFAGLSDDMGFRPVLLTGQLKKSERQTIYKGIGTGRHNLVIGTQSLIQGGLSFSNLGLVIIDEQHRFGVRQRALMESKGRNPNLLVMTATPIPRTLAITLYGDMDISTIKEYPKGHRAVLTRLLRKTQKREVYSTLKRKMAAGEQAFVICPVIEKSEERDLKNAVDMAEKLQKIFSPRFRTGLIHGRLSPGERETVMDEFRKGHIDLLVGTTVIEVGVHVPRATVMVIEHPERFGLAQLHQLRGRVGRGSERGLCYLMTSENLPDKSMARLEILVKSHDGFEIAQKDLELRGQGELTGMRQAGLGELDFREVMSEPELLKRAREEAEQMISADPELLNPRHGPLREMVVSLLTDPLDL